MSDYFTANVGALLPELALIKANSEITFQMMLKTIPEENRQYWLDQRRREEIEILVSILKPMPGNLAGLDSLRALQAELDALQSKLKPRD